MKQMVATGVLLVVLGGCSTELETGMQTDGEAARADSSAAGYDVGPRSSRATERVPGHQSPASRQAPVPGALASRGANAREPDSTAGFLARGGARDPELRQVSIAAETARGRGSDPGRSGPRSNAVLPPLSPERERFFLTSDSTMKTATFQLSAGDELVDRVSFNGATRGARVLTVPLGWETRIVFVNRDSELPHSVTVVAATEILPEDLAPPAFAHAQTVKVSEGLLEGDSDEIAFRADRTGRFFLACGVTGHAQRGQWLSLIVSDTVARPSYR